MVNNNLIIGIDPGAQGGIAWKEGDEPVQAVKMPSGMTEQLDFLFSLVAPQVTPQVTVFLEKVGLHRQGNSASSSAKFARHCGHLEAGLYMLSVPVKQVAPIVWQKKVFGALPRDKMERKRAIKEEMARQHPHLKVTLATSDALGILTWGKG